MLHFTKSSNSKNLHLFMDDGSIIPYVDTCNQLNYTISIESDTIILDYAVNEFYMIIKCMFSNFSFSDCSTLSYLFNTYCMNIYGSPLWEYCNNNLLELPHFILHGENHCVGFGRFQMLLIITFIHNSFHT